MINLLCMWIMLYVLMENTNSILLTTKAVSSSIFYMYIYVHNPAALVLIKYASNFSLHNLHHAIYINYQYYLFKLQLAKLIKTLCQVHRSITVT